MPAGAPELRIRMLGGLEVEVAGELRPLPALGRARSLLAYLALNPQAHSRGMLAARFWPDVLDESARTSLRTALSAVRRSLGKEGLLVATRDAVSLTVVWTDAQEVERLIAAGRAEEALALYRGPLLAGLDDEWIYEARDALRDRVAEVLADLASEAEAAGDLAGAIERTRAWAALDPLDEAPVRELMRRLAAAGDRADALAAYERLGERLRSRLGIVPSAAAREVARTVRATEPSTPSGGVVALLFTDLVGATESLGSIGEDRTARLRRDCLSLLRDVIAGHGGDEVKSFGDGLMAVFSSLVDAVRCGVAIQQSIARFGPQRAAPMGVRVGVNAGEPFHDEDDWFGTPVVVAKRLCDHAEGGQILVSRLVRELLGGRGGFAFRDVGPLNLESLSTVVWAADVDWSRERQRTIPLPPPLVDAAASNLVGRTAELARVRASWAEARAGHGRVVLLAGEPGIGKTRLAAELCRLAQAEEGALVMFGHCDEEVLAPYQPIVEALDRYAGEVAADELRVQAGEDRALLARLIPGIERNLPRPAAHTADDPGSSRLRLFGAVERLLREAARARPAILVLDDLHWADEHTLLLLPHLVRELRRAPLLVIATVRTSEQEPRLAKALAALRRLRAADEIALGGLDRAEVTALIEARTGGEYVGDTASIHARSDGNPFFVEEIIRAGPGESLPRSIADLIRRRLARLDERSARTLAAAAVVGAEFDLSLLADATGVDADALIEPLEQAVEVGAIREVAGVPGRFSFPHALVRESVYGGLSAARRVRLHQRVGEALARASPQAPPATLAYHFSAAGDLERGFAHTIAAARSARRVAAVEVAGRHYDEAVELAGRLGREPDADAAVRELLIERAELRHERSDVAGSTLDAERALAAARTAGDRRAEMRALDQLGYVRRESDVAVALPYHRAALAIARELADVGAEVAILNRLSLLHTVRLEIDEGLAAAEQALALAREAGDPALLARGLDALKLSTLWLGDLDRVEEVTAELLALVTAEQPWYRGFALLESAFVPIGRRDWSLAEERLGAAQELARRAGSVGLDGLVGEARSWLRREQGRLQEAIDEARSSREVLASISNQFVGWVSATLATALLQRGEHETAVAELEHGAAVAQAIGARGELLRCVGQLAFARSLRGDAAGAVTEAAEAERLITECGVPGGAVPLIAAHGILGASRARLANGDRAAARRLAAPVLGAAERSGWCEFAESAAELLSAAGRYPSGQKTS